MPRIPSKSRAARKNKVQSKSKARSKSKSKRSKATVKAVPETRVKRAYRRRKELPSWTFAYSTLPPRPQELSQQSPPTSAETPQPEMVDLILSTASGTIKRDIQDRGDFVRRLQLSARLKAEFWNHFDRVQSILGLRRGDRRHLRPALDHRRLQQLRRFRLLRKRCRLLQHGIRVLRPFNLKQRLTQCGARRTTRTGTPFLARVAPARPAFSIAVPAVPARLSVAAVSASPAIFASPRSNFASASQNSAARARNVPKVIP